MPYRGTKKRNPSAKSKERMNIEKDLYEELEMLARSRGLINKRNGDGNRSELIRLAVDSFKLFSRTYPERLPYPQELIYLLSRLDEAIASQDLKTLQSLQSRIQQNIEYLESWGAKVAMEEAVAEGVIKTKNGSWIV